MAGASFLHGRLANRLSAPLELHLKGTICQAVANGPLQELLSVSQDRHNAELYRRESSQDGRFSREGLDASIELTSIGYNLSRAELYADILPHTAAHS
jgi:hypothetical protein